MRFFLLYFAAACVAVNVAGNLTATAAESIESRNEARAALLCDVNPAYCRR